MYIAKVTDPDDQFDLCELFNVGEDEKPEFLDIFLDHISGEVTYTEMKPLMSGFIYALKKVIRNMNSVIAELSYNEKQILAFWECVAGREDTLVEAAQLRIEKITIRRDIFEGTSKATHAQVRVTCYGLRYVLDCPDAQFTILLRNNWSNFGSLRKEYFSRNPEKANPHGHEYDDQGVSGQEADADDCRECEPGLAGLG